MHCLAVYVKKELPFVQDVSLETVHILIYVFDWLYFIQCLTSFFSIDYFLHLYA